MLGLRRNTDSQRGCQGLLYWQLMHIKSTPAHRHMI